MWLHYKVSFRTSKSLLQWAAKGGGKSMKDASPDKAQASLLDRGLTYSAGRTM